MKFRAKGVVFWSVLPQYGLFWEKNPNFPEKKGKGIPHRRSKMGEKLVVLDFDEIAATPRKSTLLITKMGLKLL